MHVYYHNSSCCDTFDNYHSGCGYQVICVEFYINSSSEIYYY
jgi:hypothetical protein